MTTYAIDIISSIEFVEGSCFGVGTPKHNWRFYGVFRKGVSMGSVAEKEYLFERWDNKRKRNTF